MCQSGGKKGKDLYRAVRLALRLAVSLALLAGCGRQQAAEGSVILTLAAFGRNPELEAQVAEYNRAHADRQIVVEQYARSEVLEEDGIVRLQREIATGKGPDLIDFGAGYATSDIVGGYTEDLWPYLEKLRGESGEAYFDNILDAFRYNGKLYAVPVSFRMKTFAGSRAVLGERDSWSIQELADCYAHRKAGAILYPGETKKDVFGTLMYGNADYYIDWETGSCDFESDAFRQVLAFADQFPDTLQLAEDDSVKRTFQEGGALVYPLALGKSYDICNAGQIFDTEDITYIGFPVREGSGTVIAPSALMLAISAGSGHKDAAWEFIAGFLGREYQSKQQKGFPILRDVLEQELEINREAEYQENADRNLVPVVKHAVQFEGEERAEIYNITEEQAESLLRLIDTASLYSAVDSRLYGILLEEADGYFCGDKSLEQTCRTIQGRVSMYVGEKVRSR